MAFSATFTWTINAVAKILNRVKEMDYASEYRLYETDGMYQVFIRHNDRVDPVSKETYLRHNLEFRHIIYASGSTPERTNKYFFVYDVPRAGALAQIGYEAAEFGSKANLTSLQTDLLNYLS